MNEELQRELVSILRAMKDGSPEAFKVLVEQRSLYCWGHAIIGLLMLVGAFILYRVGRWLATCWAKAQDEDAQGRYGFSTVLCGVACIVTCVQGCRNVFYIPEALAPLGRVLEVLR